MLNTHIKLPHVTMDCKVVRPPYGFVTVVEQAIMYRIQFLSISPQLATLHSPWILVNQILAARDLGRTKSLVKKRYLLDYLKLLKLLWYTTPQLMNGNANAPTLRTRSILHVFNLLNIARMRKKH